MNLKKVFGKNVRYYRFKKGYTQEKFAEYVNLNTTYVSELEHGKYGSTFEKVEKIAEVLEVEPFELFIERENINILPDRVDMKC